MFIKAAFIWSKQFKMTVFDVNVFWNVIYSCDAKLNVLASLLQSSVSHDPSEIIQICWFATQLLSIIFGAQILIKVIFIIMMETVFANSYFCENWLMNTKLKTTAFIWNRTLLWMPLLSLLINLMYLYQILFKQNILRTPNFWMVAYH